MRKLKSGMRKKEGQILILVLLVVVVALAVGLSVASRNLTNLKTSTQAEQSQRAFTAAEGGVEDVLSKLNTVANVINVSSVGDPPQSGCTKDATNANQANCTLQNASITTGVAGTVNVVASSSYTKTVETGDVAQVNLSGTANPTTFEVNWGTDADVDADALGETASMEFTFICNGVCTLSANSGADIVTTGSSYTQIRLAYGNNSHALNESGFSTCTSGSTINSVVYRCKATFTLKSTTFVLLRMKPFWNRATVNIAPSGGSSLPVQTYSITSVATTDTGVSRKVQVYRDALPQLPAVFDYVLYSGGDIKK